ncbi:MAG: hypothetical protein WCG15_03140 [Actinomycetes bacterium]
MSNQFMPTNTGIGAIPPEFALQQQQLNRQQQMAQLLLQQGQQMAQGPTGQMVSGRYVPNSFFQNLQPVANMLVGAYLAKKGDEKALDLAQKIKNQEAQDINKFFQYQYGSPRQVTEMAGPFGEGVGEGNKDIPMPIAEIPEVPRNPQMAYQVAAQSQSPILRQQLADMLKGKTVKEGETVIRYNPLTGREEATFTGGMSLPSDVKAAAIRVGLDPTKANTWGPNELQLINNRIEADKRAGKTDVSVNLGQKGFDNTLKLRSDFRAEPVYKSFQEVESAYGQINKGLDAKSPAGDLAAATKFMKLLDPTSVVRESELAMAMQATGALDKLYNYAKMIATGEKLTESQRKDFRTLAGDFYSTAYDQYNTKREEYVGIAKRNELNIEDVVGKEPKAPTVAQIPMFAVNQTTGERIQSTDGGKTWKSVPKAK